MHAQVNAQVTYGDGDMTLGAGYLATHEDSGIMVWDDKVNGRRDTATVVAFDDSLGHPLLINEGEFTIIVVVYTLELNELCPRLAT